MAWKLFAFLISTIAVHTFALRLPEYESESRPAEYEFSYSVKDDKTGDIKSQKESRKGDKVDGSYELIDSDGYRRLVIYQADEHSGFEATVHREPTNIKIPIPEPQYKYKERSYKILAAPSYSPPLQLIEKSIRSEGREDNHVSFSAPHIAYKY